MMGSGQAPDQSPNKQAPRARLASRCGACKVEFARILCPRGAPCLVEGREGAKVKQKLPWGPAPSAAVSPDHTLQGGIGQGH